ncbi:MAG: class I adenylate-forming enzyme family protein, partial [Planctomycetota bacterium]
VDPTGCLWVRPNPGLSTGDQQPSPWLAGLAGPVQLSNAIELEPPASVGLLDEHGFINTGDLVQRHGDRYAFLGRGEGLINVGGRKVVPQRVESVLLECPEVALSRVYAKRSVFAGSLVVADVVVHQVDRHVGDDRDGVILEDRLRDHCRSRLDKHEVPAFIQLTKTIKMNATGKTLR